MHKIITMRVDEIQSLPAVDFSSFLGILLLPSRSAECLDPFGIVMEIVTPKLLNLRLASETGWYLGSTVFCFFFFAENHKATTKTATHRATVFWYTFSILILHVVYTFKIHVALPQVTKSGPLRRDLSWTLEVQKTNFS